jgi:hypothetical protein
MLHFSLESIGQVVNPSILVGRLAHPDAPEQKASGAPVYAPSAIVARGYTRKFRFLSGTPGYVKVSEYCRRLITDICESSQGFLEAESFMFNHIHIIVSVEFRSALFLYPCVSRFIRSI